jgi:ABC-2 type transport system ATP-binding protein
MPLHSPSTATPLLQAQNLHKAYNGKPALKGVSLTLQAGEMCALLGPNGAGKSTLLQLLTGLFSPDQGQITVLGHDMQTQPARALAGLGVVFQQSALDMDLPVRSNLLFHTDLHGIPRAVARQRIDDGLAAMGIGDQARAVVRSLSGGTRRKVELVRALLHRPQLLLMDEATVGLDPASRQQLLDAVRALCRERGMAVLWATHLIEEAQMADRLMLLHQGSVRFDGSLPTFMEAAQGGDFHAEVLRQMEKSGL